MSASTKIARLITGTLLVIVISVATFVLLARWTHTWGATESEVARALPGDELMERTRAILSTARRLTRRPRRCGRGSRRSATTGAGSIAILLSRIC